MKDNIVLVSEIKVVISKTARDTAGTSGAIWLHFTER